MPHLKAAGDLPVGLKFHPLQQESVFVQLASPIAEESWCFSLCVRRR